MELVLNPTYKDIFEEEEPEISDLLISIPSGVCISLLSYISSQLYISKGKDTQIQIFNFLTQRFDKNIKGKIKRNINNQVLKDTSNKIQLFTLIGNLEFIHFELINYRNFELSDTNPTQELNFFKAYFVITTDLQRNYSIDKNLKTKNPRDYFRKQLWPIIVSQVNINQNVNPYVGLIKGLHFLDYFERNYNNYLTNFLSLNGKNNKWQYMTDLMGLLSHAWVDNPKNEMTAFRIPTSNDYFTLFDHLILDLDRYKKKYKDNKLDFTGLKDKPLMKLNDSLIIMNWNFISNKMYDGLVFDFYSNSGIKTNKKFKKFTDYKNYIGTQITEKSLFKKCIKPYCNKKYSKLIFDDNEIEGFPDAYYRTGNNVFLFELKDAYFPANVINSYSYTNIKKVLDSKFNSENKGTGQLAKSIIDFSKNKFTAFDEKLSQIRDRNITIHPIIIYTDSTYESPGFNLYLAEQLKIKIKTIIEEGRFKIIKDLTFINISFFVNHLELVNKMDLIELIDFYQSKVKKLSKKHLRTNDFDTLHKMNNPLEFFMDDFLKIKKMDFNRPDFESVAKLLDLKMDL